MLDLFDTLVLPGFASREDVITAAEEAKLIARIDAQSLTPFKFQGWTGKQLTTSFGWHYDFDRAHFGPTDPMPCFGAATNTG